MTQPTAPEAASEKSRSTFTIIVNTRKKDVHTERLTFEAIVHLAFPGAEFGPDIVYAVTYRGGPSQNPVGDLVAGKSVFVKDGMIFNVKRTNRS